MKLSELFAEPGFGVMSTAAADGSVNSAIYARPHVIDEMTLVWGMTDKRTYQNISQNRNASYLFKVNGSGFRGVRLVLEMTKSEKDGEMLATIKHNADNLVSPGTGAAVTHAVWFRVTEIRSLI
jgi:hypothetical protein